MHIFRKQLNLNYAALSGAAAAGAPAFTWNPSDKGTNTTLLNSNRDLAYNSGGYETTRATVGQSTGKWSCEFLAGTQVGGSNSIGIGLADSGASKSAYLGSSPIGCMYLFVNVSTYFTGGGLLNPGSLGSVTLSAGDKFTIEFDVDNKMAWFAKNNTWLASGNPAAGTNPWVTWTSAITVYIAGTVNQPVTAYLPISLPASRTYSPSSGFTSLNA